jgi:hypothetical protein
MVTKDKFGKTGRAIKMCQSKMPLDDADGTTFT